MSNIGEQLRELFQGRVDIVTDYNGGRLIHHLRESSKEEDLLFRKRSTAVKFVNGKAEPADIAFEAPILLYDTIAESVTVEIDGESQDLPEFQEKIPPDLKCAVISAFQNRFQIIVKRNGEMTQ